MNRTIREAVELTDEQDMLNEFPLDMTEMEKLTSTTALVIIFLVLLVGWFFLTGYILLIL